MKKNSTTITPFLTVNNGMKALEFYKAAYKAIELEKYESNENRIVAQLAVNGAYFWLGDEEPENGNYCPDSTQGSPVRIILNTKDSDNLFERALELGSEQICPMTTEDDWRIGKLKDPFGHIWEIGYQF